MMIQSLEELLVYELADLYDAEHQLIETLPWMVEAAMFSELKFALTEHFHQTKKQAKRLEQVFGSMGKSVSREACEALQGIIDEGNELLDSTQDGAIRDAALIAVVQRIEHYEMSGYGTARTFAYLLGHAVAAELLQETLDEEEQADKKLSQIANQINVLAMG